MHPAIHKLLPPPYRRPALALALIALAMVGLLRLQGRLWIAASGAVYPWVGDVWSADNSQHLLDPYSFSHLLHGILFYGLLWLVVPRLAVAWRLVLATALEAGWEVLENTQRVIDHYRTTTASLGYTGDTVVNSGGDLLCCVLGFGVARYLGFTKSLVLVIGVELASAWLIRDGLLLNIIMLLYPIEAIKTWQMG